MMRSLLYRISGRLPCRIISEDGRPYLERYYVCTLFGLRVYLHRFVGSDPNWGTHDHPWPWAFSVVLSGWYVEELRGGVVSPILGRTPYRFRAVRRFNFLTGDTFHRVILPHGRRDTWTLFAHRAKVVKTWGFWHACEVGAIWIPYRHQTGDREWWKEVPLGRDEERRMPL